MARILGKPGRYVSDEAGKRHGYLLFQCVAFVGLWCVVEGVCIEKLFRLVALPSWISAAILMLVVVVLLVFSRWGIGKMKSLEKQRLAMRSGTVGEVRIASILRDLPDDYYVINDLTTSYGNLDHVVVGPNGVFVLDAKNWRGVIAPDGRGELLLNGRSTDKKYVNQLVCRMMGIHDKVRLLAPSSDPYYQAVLVFISARVEAKWGATGRAHCITDDQLVRYILDKEKLIQPRDVKSIARAFRDLACADPDFSRQSTNTVMVQPLQKITHAQTY